MMNRKQGPSNSMPKILVTFRCLSISIIPQEPIIFSESVFKNLDPTEKYSYERLWSVLKKKSVEEVHLRKK